MDKVINLNLLSHPINWIIILLMLTIAGIAGHMFASLIGIEPPTSNTPAAASYTPAS